MLANSAVCTSSLLLLAVLPLAWMPRIFLVVEMEFFGFSLPTHLLYVLHLSRVVI
jgi:hypothetical protein